MINSALDLITFLQSNFSMPFALVLYTILAIALSKSIKKHYKVYYWVFGLLSAGFVIPFVFRLCGVALPFNLGNIPIVGLCFGELSSAGNFVHPILILIMYMGAFSPKTRYIGRLMSIRKELSIIVGFPVIAHALKRLFTSFVGGWDYFFDHEVYMQSPRVTSVLGSGISSFVYVLGLVMFVLFLVLWITSFDSVHRKLGTQRWKSVQKWSYGLYAMLFIHAIGINLGGLISSNAREQQQAERAKIEVVEHSKGERPQREHPQGEQHAKQSHSHSQPTQQPQAQQGGHGSRPKPFKLSEIEISRSMKSVFSMIILVLIYGSYLYFRLRKSAQDKARRTK